MVTILHALKFKMTNEKLLKIIQNVLNYYLVFRLKTVGKKFLYVNA